MQKLTKSCTFIPLTWTWLGFRSGAITGAWYRILTKLSLQSVDPGLWTLPMKTWSCLGFLYKLVPILTYVAWSSIENSPLDSASWVPGMARLFHDHCFLLCHRCNVAGPSMLYEVNLNSNHCLFSELPSASTRVWHAWAVVTAHPFEFKVSRCRMSQFARCLFTADWDSNVEWPCLTLER